MKEWVRVNLVMYGCQIFWDVLIIQCVKPSNIKCIRAVNVVLNIAIATLGCVGVVFVESSSMLQFSKESSSQHQFVWLLRCMAYIRLFSMFIIMMLLFLLCLISFCYICLGGNWSRLTRGLIEHKD